MTSDGNMDSKESEKETVTDRLSKALGEFGRWHVVLILVFAVTTKMCTIWMQMGIIFLAQKTTFCCIERNSTGEMLNSTCYSDCLKYEYYTEFENTIISQWGLICEKAWLANFSQMMVMFGVLVGSSFFGFFADRYGRRPALLTAGILQICTSFATPFCPEYWIFTTVRFFQGAAGAGTIVISFVIMIEVTGPRYREFMNCLFSLPIPIGEMFMPLFAYYLRAWNKFSFGIAVPNLLCLLYFFLVPESPKWLISLGRLEEASVVMANAAKCNKLPAEDMLDVAKKISDDNNIDTNSKNKASYIDLLTEPSLRIKNLLSCVIWFNLGLIFFGSNQYIGQTSSNVFISVAMAGALQIPGILLSSYCCKRFGRRITLISLLVISAISNGLLSVPDDWFYVKLVVGSIGVSCSSGAFSTVYMFTTELFPTVARNMAMGASSTVCRVGSMLAPFVAGLSEVYNWIPPLIFSIAALSAAATCFYLPETRGKVLMDLIAERSSEQTSVTSYNVSQQHSSQGSHKDI